MQLLCEICGLRPATSLSHFTDSEDSPKGRWKLACACTAYLIENYYIEFPLFENEPERWIAHLSEKQWFDLQDFLDAVQRAGLDA